MKTWLIQTDETVNPAADTGEPLYVCAPSEPHAREWAKLNGHRVWAIYEVPLSSVPAHTTPHTFPQRIDRIEDPLERIAQSALVRAPIVTIALGILLAHTVALLLLLLLGFRLH